MSWTVLGKAAVEHYKVVKTIKCVTYAAAAKG